MSARGHDRLMECLPHHTTLERLDFVTHLFFDRFKIGHHDLLIFSRCVPPFGMLGYRFLSPLHGLIQLDFRVLRKGQHVLQIVQVGGTSKRSQ